MGVQCEEIIAISLEEAHRHLTIDCDQVSAMLWTLMDRWETFS